MQSQSLTLYMYVIVVVLLWRRSYIKWTRDHFPTDGSRALELIERATAEFVQDSRYTADERYVRLWIEYVSTCRGRVLVCLCACERWVSQP